MKISELKSLAEKATPGPYINVEAVVEDQQGHIVAQTFSTPSLDGRSLYQRKLDNASYISAANPQTILDLIAKVEGLSEALSGYVLGDPIEGYIDDAGESGREALAKFGADVPLNEVKSELK